MRKILMAIFLTVNSCTYSITQVQTQGSAADVIDETNAFTPTTSVNSSGE